MNGRYHILKRMAVVVLGIYLFCNCFFLSSCSSWNWSVFFGNWNPQGDWEYDLIYDYSICRVNSSRITLHRKDAPIGQGIVIESYITCFAYNNRFIAVRKLDVLEGDSQEKILQMDFDQAKYFIVDAEIDTVYGPYSSTEEFQAQCSNLKVGELNEWIDTYPDPKGVKY